MRTNKTNIKYSIVIPALIAVLNLIPAGRVAAQTFTVLYSFTGGGPPAVLVTNSSGNTLYGTAAWGGSSGWGTVFAVNTDGTGFTNLHSFTALGVYPYQTNGDGANPQGELVLSGTTLYGTAQSGGSSGAGTVFAVNTDGTGFTNLYSFAGYPSDGAGPQAGLILSGNTLYGTAVFGGSSSAGTLFAITTNGVGFRNLHTFSGGSDGGGPLGRLILSGNTLYGSAGGGGLGVAGTVFAINTNGTGFTNLYSFAAGSHSCCSGLYCYCLINSDGAYPYAGLILSGRTLYGTASGGGSSGQGTVFALNTDGTGFTNLHSFTMRSAPYPVYGGGSNIDGADPERELTLSGNTLYGTTQGGGSSGYGTAFSLSFRPQLTIARSGPYLVLSWPANVAGFDYTGYRLQKASAITGPWVYVPGSWSPYFIPITAPQQFFRLVQ